MRSPLSFIKIMLSALGEGHYRIFHMLYLIMLTLGRRNLFGVMTVPCAEWYPIRCLSRYPRFQAVLMSASQSYHLSISEPVLSPTPYSVLFPRLALTENALLFTSTSMLLFFEPLPWSSFTDFNIAPYSLQYNLSSYTLFLLWELFLFFWSFFMYS